MRIGLARSSFSSPSGRVFQYEIVLLKALGEIAGTFPEALVYLCYDSNDLFTLAKASGGLSYLGMPVLPFSKPSHYQPPPPDALLREVPSTPAPFDPNIISFNEGANEALRQNRIDLLMLLSPNLPGFSFR